MAKVKGMLLLNTKKKKILKMHINTLMGKKLIINVYVLILNEDVQNLNFDPEDWGVVLEIQERPKV